jgi:hypothetical protein
MQRIPMPPDLDEIEGLYKRTTEFPTGQAFYAPTVAPLRLRIRRAARRYGWVVLLLGVLALLLLSLRLSSGEQAMAVAMATEPALAAADVRQQLKVERAMRIAEGRP